MPKLIQRGVFAPMLATFVNNYQTQSTERVALTSDKRNTTYSSNRITPLAKYTFTSEIKPADMIIFMHTPKTGGTNLSYIAAAISMLNPHFTYTRFRGPRTKNKSSIKIDDGWTGAYSVAKQALLENSKGYNFICGHFPFGLHNYASNAKYVALVRDPLQRSLSLTNFNFQRGLIRSVTEAEETLLSEIDNPQTRLFAGVEYMHGPCTKETLELAKANISRYFMLVAPTEDTDTFLAVLASIQQWDPIAIARSQITGEKIINSIPQHLRARLESKNAFDLELYKWVQEQWSLWKDLNINTFQLATNPNTSFLCIMPDFPVKQTPVVMTKDAIDEHNKNQGSELFNTSQYYSNNKLTPQ